MTTDETLALMKRVRGLMPERKHPPDSDLTLREIVYRKTSLATVDGKLYEISVKELEQR